MARKKKVEDAVNTDGWLTTYADLLSLLLCFFVMMYTASVPDDARMQWILRSFSNVRGNVVDFANDDPDEDITGTSQDNPHLVAPHTIATDGERPGIAGILPMTFDDLFNWVADIVDAHDLDDSVSVEMYEGRMHIRFDDEILFRAESSDLLEAGAQVLRLISPGIQAINRFIENVEVAGHTAPPPPGVRLSNWGVTNPWVLSSARATNVTVYLDDVLRMVDSNKMRPTGYGPWNPHYDHTNEQSNRRNRRIELVLTRSDFMPDDTPGMLDMLQYDFLLPILPGGPLNFRQPCPSSIDRDEAIWNEMRNRQIPVDDLFVPPAPTPGDGRGFDFVLPTLPRA
jgi:chemotaxis protein MotB